MRRSGTNVRELCFLALMAAVLFVQETLLSSLPNIQLTVLLLMVYAATVGLSKAILVMTVHVLLDNLLWGSMSPVQISAMWIGWLFVLVIGYALRKRSLALIVAGSVAGSILYCLTFALFQSLFLKVDIVAYLIADILFEVLLCCSSAVTVTFLYRPAQTLLKRFYARVAGMPAANANTEAEQGEAHDDESVHS